MARSTCAKCGNGTFELKEQAPRSSTYELLFVQCTSCGAPVGVIEGRTISDMMIRQNRALEAIAQHVGVAVNLD